MLKSLSQHLFWEYFQHDKSIFFPLFPIKLTKKKNPQDLMFSRYQERANVRLDTAVHQHITRIFPDEVNILLPLYTTVSLPLPAAVTAKLYQHIHLHTDLSQMWETWGQVPAAIHCLPWAQPLLVAPWQPHLGGQPKPKSSPRSFNNSCYISGFF